MNTHDTSVLLAPDTQLMNSSLTFIYASIRSLQLDFLPAIEEKMPHLDSTTQRAQATFNENLSRVLVMLQNTNLGSLDTTRSRIESAAELSQEQKQVQLQRLDQRLRDHTSALARSLDIAAHSLLQRIDDLLQIKLQLPDDELANSLQRQLDAAQANQGESDLQLNALIQDRRILNETISVYEQENLASVFLNVLPSAEELAQLALAGPKVAAFQLGLSRLRTLLVKISGSLTYRELIGERDRITQRYEEYLARFRGAQNDVMLVQRRLDTLMDLNSLHNARNAWAREARKASDSLSIFVQASLSPAAGHLASQQDLNRLRDYLESFHGIRREL